MTYAASRFGLAPPCAPICGFTCPELGAGGCLRGRADRRSRPRDRCASRILGRAEVRVGRSRLCRHEGVVDASTARSPFDCGPQRDLRVGREAPASALTSAERRSGAWKRYRGGVVRSTSFGRQTVVFAPQVIEELLTVRTRTGPKLWRWRLDSGSLTPRLGADGGVSFGYEPRPEPAGDHAGEDLQCCRARCDAGRHSLVAAPRRERLVARAGARRSAPAAALRDRPRCHPPLVSDREHWVIRSEQLDAHASDRRRRA